MRITHLGHSAVLVETDDARVLIDPGNFSDSWHGLTDLDAILITHNHPDHADPEQLPGLVQANPQAKIYVEPSIVLAAESGSFPAIGADDLAGVGVRGQVGVRGPHRGQGGAAVDPDGVGIDSGIEQPLPLLPPHPEQFGQVIVLAGGGGRLVLGRRSHDSRAYWPPQVTLVG